jgi:hypothetical protein
MRALLALSA